MRPRSIIILLTACIASMCDSPAASPRPQQPAAVPTGILQVRRDALVDANGQRILLRGTEVEEPAPTDENADAVSATTFSTIRQRWNMNTVRLPVNVPAYVHESVYRGTVTDIVRKANRFGLVVVLSAPGATAQFWSQCAAEFKSNPMVLFEVSSGTDSVRAIRSSAANQPILIRRDSLEPDLPISDANVIYEIAIRFGDPLKTVPDGAPVLANIGDLECPSVPTDPSTLDRVVEETLAYLDFNNASWIVSSFRPGKLIRDYRNFDATRFENGFDCARPYLFQAGIGMAVQFHLWNTKILSLFTVNGQTGNFVLPRGGLAIAYGPILAEEEDGSARRPPPTTLGGISVRVTDSQGKARLAGAHPCPGRMGPS